MAERLIAEIRIEYGFDEQSKKRHTQHLRVDAINSSTGGNVNIDTSFAVGASSVSSVRDYIANYLGFLKTVTQPNVLILAAHLTWLQTFTDSGIINNLGDVDYNIQNWAVPAGRIGQRGPNGSPFFWGKQKVLATGKSGGIHWGYIDGSFVALQKSFAASQISTDAQDNYNGLTSLSGQILSYAAPTRALHAYLEYTDKAVPSSLVYFGIVNG